MAIFIGFCVVIFILYAIGAAINSLSSGTGVDDKSYSVEVQFSCDDILDGKIQTGKPRIEYLKRGGVKKITIPVSFKEMNLSALLVLKKLKGGKKKGKKKKKS